MEKLKSVFGVILVAIVASSCGDNTVVDIRQDAVGTYNYTPKDYLLNNGVVSLYAIQPPSVFTVTLDPDNKSGLIFTEGATIIKVDKVTKTDNGFTFDVPSQSITWDDGSHSNIIGFNSFVPPKVSNSFTSSILLFSLSFSFESNASGRTFVAESTANKK